VQAFNGMSIELEGSPEQQADALQKLRTLPQA
jgi:hypothetical protein